MSTNKILFSLSPLSSWQIIPVPLINFEGPVYFLSLMTGENRRRCIAIKSSGPTSSSWPSERRQLQSHARIGSRYLFASGRIPVCPGAGRGRRGVRDDDISTYLICNSLVRRGIGDVEKRRRKGLLVLVGRFWAAWFYR